MLVNINYKFGILLCKLKNHSIVIDTLMFLNNEIEDISIIVQNSTSPSNLKYDTLNKLIYHQTKNKIIKEII